MQLAMSFITGQAITGASNVDVSATSYAGNIAFGPITAAGDVNLQFATSGGSISVKGADGATSATASSGAYTIAVSGATATTQTVTLYSDSYGLSAAGDIDVSVSDAKGDTSIGALTSVSGDLTIAANGTSGKVDVTSLTATAGGVSVNVTDTTGAVNFGNVTAGSGDAEIILSGSTGAISGGTISASAASGGITVTATDTTGAITLSDLTASGAITVTSNGSSAVSLGAITGGSTVDLTAGKGGLTLNGMTNSLQASGDVTITTTDNGALTVNGAIDVVSGGLTVSTAGTTTLSKAVSIDGNFSFTNETKGVHNTVGDSTAGTSVSLGAADTTLSLTTSTGNDAFIFTGEAAVTKITASGDLGTGTNSIAIDASLSTGNVGIDLSGLSNYYTSTITGSKVSDITTTVDLAATKQTDNITKGSGDITIHGFEKANDHLKLAGVNPASGAVDVAASGDGTTAFSANTMYVFSSTTYTNTSDASGSATANFATDSTIVDFLNAALSGSTSVTGSYALINGSSEARIYALTSSASGDVASVDQIAVIGVDSAIAKADIGTTDTSTIILSA